MIKYTLICEGDHEFEIWFSKSSDFDDQAPKGLIVCPYCGSTRVQKGIMAPNVSTSRKKEAAASKRKKAMTMMNKAADKIRHEIEQSCDYVGDKFADEARSIHYGEKPERAIYGQASPKEAADLHEEGVGIAPLPDIFTPKPKSEQN